MRVVRLKKKKREREETKNMKLTTFSKAIPFLCPVPPRVDYQRSLLTGAQKQAR